MMEDQCVAGSNGLKITLEGFMSLQPRLRLNLLNFLIRWQRYEDALPLVQRMVEEQPDGLLYRAMFVKALASLGRLDEAAAIVGDLDYQHSHRPNTLSAAGDLEFARGDLAAALKRYLAMLEVNPESPKAFRRLAALYLAANQPDKAHVYCRKVLDHQATLKDQEDFGPHPTVLRVLAEVHKLRGDDSVATEILQELAEREKDEEERMLERIQTTPRGTGKPVKPKPIPAAFETTEVPVSETARPPAPTLPQEARDCLSTVFGHDGFRTGQEEAIARMLAGQDLLITMPTGAGKSLCYQLPASLGRKVVVISPLIALMKDQVDGLPEHLAARATLINSTLDSDELEKRQGDIAAGRYDLVYAAPERLRLPPFLHAVKRAGIDLFVVDEVHCVSIWGHDFRPDYLFISKALGHLGNPTFCGMTATAGPEMRREIESRIGRRLISVSTGTYRPNLRLEVHQVSKSLEKLRMLSRICHSEEGCGIIYANSRIKTEEIASFLRTAGVQAGHYHAGMDPESRVAAQEAFMTGKCRVVAATVAFGMGIDKRDVRFVAHFALPKSLENYYQEAGRAGRDGLPSRCMLFYSPGDKARLTGWNKSNLIRMDDLKAVYQSIKGIIPRGEGPVHEDDIVRDSGLEDTKARVAVSMLERAGLLQRGLDVPMSLSIRVRSLDGADEHFREFVDAARLKERQRISLDLVDLSGRTGTPPDELESLLFQWRDQGLLDFRTSGRMMYIRLCRADSGARAKLEGMLDAHKNTAERKVQQLAGYAKIEECRHNAISRHFGEAAVSNCTACDNCLKNAAPSMLTDEHLLILKGMQSLPIRLGKRGLVRALMGAASCPIQPHEWPHVGAFLGKTRSSVEELINDLTEWGYLERDGNPIRPLLVLTAAGRKMR